MDLNGYQWYMGLQYHMEEALIEKYGIDNKRPASSSPQVALFSHAYYNDINCLNSEKIYDYCFIGSINSAPERRQWILDFAKKFFTANSIFINTDTNSNWTSLGEFDYTDKQLGYCPKDQQDNQSKRVQYRKVSENVFYFETMKKSKFVLCPCGDSSWSFRFYETLMCKSLPIVESQHHTYRTMSESKIKYKYLLYTDTLPSDVDYCNLINENTKIFEQKHLL